MKYLDDFVDSLGVTNHSMTACGQSVPKWRPRGDCSNTGPLHLIHVPSFQDASGQLCYEKELQSEVPKVR